MAASPPLNNFQRTDAAAVISEERSTIGNAVETAVQYVTLEQEIMDDANEELDVARRRVRLLHRRAQGHPVPPSTFQEFHFPEASEAHSASEIQSLLAQAEATLTAAIERWNTALQIRTLKISLRKMDLDRKKRDEWSLSREILNRITDEPRDTNAAGQLSEPGGSIPDSVSAALRAAYGASTNEQLPCAVCGFKNGDNHAAAMPIDGVPPTVSRARILPWAVCEACGIRYDATNFIPLCGRLGWKGTCRHLFDSNRLAFVFKRQAGGWKCCAGNDHSALRGIVQFPNHPNPRGMHARAICSARNVMFTACDLADMLPPDDSMPESSSGAALGGDGREKLSGSGGGRRAAGPAVTVAEAVVRGSWPRSRVTSQTWRR